MVQMSISQLLPEDRAAETIEAYHTQGRGSQVLLDTSPEDVGR
jgi:hypothetical protein